MDSREKQLKDLLGIVTKSNLNVGISEVHINPRYLYSLIEKDIPKDKQGVPKLSMDLLLEIPSGYEIEYKSFKLVLNHQVRSFSIIGYRMG